MNTSQHGSKEVNTPRQPRLGVTVHEDADENDHCSGGEEGYDGPVCEGEGEGVSEEEEEEEDGEGDEGVVPQKYLRD